MRQTLHVERFSRPATTPESREIGDERVKIAAQKFGRRQEVPPREAESVQMHHRLGVWRIGRLTVEDVDALDLRPSFRQGRRRTRHPPRRTPSSVWAHMAQYPGGSRPA